MSLAYENCLRRTSKSNDTKPANSSKSTRKRPLETIYIIDDDDDNKNNVENFKTDRHVVTSFPSGMLDTCPQFLLKQQMESPYKKQKCFHNSTSKLATNGSFDLGSDIVIDEKRNEFLAKRVGHEPEVMEIDADAVEYRTLMKTQTSSMGSASQRPFFLSQDNQPQVTLQNERSLMISENQKRFNELSIDEQTAMLDQNDHRKKVGKWTNELFSVPEVVNLIIYSLLSMLFSAVDEENHDDSTESIKIKLKEKKAKEQKLNAFIQQFVTISQVCAGFRILSLEVVYELISKSVSFVPLFQNVGKDNNNAPNPYQITRPSSKLNRHQKPIMEFWKKQTNKPISFLRIGILRFIYKYVLGSDNQNEQDLQESKGKIEKKLPNSSIFPQIPFGKSLQVYMDICSGRKGSCLSIDVKSGILLVRSPGGSKFAIGNIMFSHPEVLVSSFKESMDYSDPNDKLMVKVLDQVEKNAKNKN